MFETIDAILSTDVSQLVPSGDEIEFNVAYATIVQEQLITVHPC